MCLELKPESRERQPPKWALASVTPFPCAPPSGCAAGALWKFVANASGVDIDEHVKAALWKCLLLSSEQGDITFVRVEVVQDDGGASAAAGCVRKL